MSMKEFGWVLIITLIIFLGGIATVYFTESSTSFNFYKSELTINGSDVTEKLYYNPDKPYHTLFRTFADPVFGEIAENADYPKNYVGIISVKCSEGNNYLRDRYSRCVNNSGLIPCYSYTQDNEYGCTFGDVYGFNKGQDYTIQSTYRLHPSNLFLINEKYYIKFVAYSPKNHKTLDSNFIVAGDIVKKSRYYPGENVIIYVPYSGSVSGYQIIELSDFQFDSSLKYLIFYCLAFLPGLVFFFVWFLFGKEKNFDVPEQLSVFPNGSRKAWEVASYFNPPFAAADKNLFSSVMIDFYHRKIIDVQVKDKETYIKLSNGPKNLDSVERWVIEILKTASKNCPAKYKKGVYFNLRKSIGPLSSSHSEIRLSAMGLGKEITKQSKKYLSKSGMIALFLGFFILMPLFMVLDLISMAIFTFALIFVSIIITSYSSLISRFKEDYYKEYLEWQAFKRYLNKSFTIRTGTTKTLVMWDKYLVYAAALGVSDKVVNELKANNLITENQAVTYRGVYVSSAHFATSSGVSSGGAHGGAGGGGVGGGGGGGR